MYAAAHHSGFGGIEASTYRGQFPCNTAGKQSVGRIWLEIPIKSLYWNDMGHIYDTLARTSSPIHSASDIQAKTPGPAGQITAFVHHFKPNISISTSTILAIDPNSFVTP
jgi:hypothetical protein